MQINAQSLIALAQSNGYGGMSGRSIAECEAAVASAAEAPQPFSFSPSTATIQWQDKNGTHSGNLASFTATADLPWVVLLTASAQSLTAISNLSQLPNLVILYVQSNSLTTLDVSGNPKLTTIEANANQLTSAAVNTIMESLMSQNNYSGALSLAGQTPAAPPTGQGIIAYEFLVQNGWAVAIDPITSFYWILPAAVVTWNDGTVHTGNVAAFSAGAVLANIQEFNASGLSLIYISSFSGFTSLLGLDLSNNRLPVSVVNAVLTELLALFPGPVASAYVNLSGQTPPATPTGAGATAAATLNANGWVVTTD